MSKIRVEVRQNTNRQNKGVGLVNVSTFQNILKFGKNKCGKRVKRIFLLSGEEILNENFQEIFQGRTEAVLVATFGEELIEGKKEKTVEDMVFNDVENPIEVAINENVVVNYIFDLAEVEEEAKKQLVETSRMPNMKFAVGLPDLHPGKGCPIGASCASVDVVYPHLVGGDIGCGMALWKTSLKNKKVKIETWANNLHGLEEAWDGDSQQWLESRGVGLSDDDNRLGTIGGGNHFAELQLIESIEDQELFDQLGLSTDFLYLLVHSGSRAYGNSILEEHKKEYGYRGLVANSELGDAYFEKHDNALKWAVANRSLIAHRFMGSLLQSEVNTDFTGEDVTADGSVKVLDIWHNCVVKKTIVEGDEEIEIYLHRKGAAPSDSGPVVIPGSRGHFSYLVQPLIEENFEGSQNAGFSLAHGAGRRWNRSKALNVGQKRRTQDLITTNLGSRVICEKRELLYEEQPDAYKPIDDIIADLVSFNLIKVIAIFRPIITYKTRVIKHEKPNYKE